MTKPFVGEFIECHNPDCPKQARFNFDGTHYHCSEECAHACLTRRSATPKLPALVMAPEVD